MISRLHIHAGEPLLRMDDVRSALREMSPKPACADFMPSSGTSSEIDIHLIEKLTALPEDQAVRLLVEYLKFAWINAFLSQSRIAWFPMTGSGSQSDEREPYELLGRYMLDEMAKEKSEYETDYADDEEMDVEDAQ